jgi:predicted enzyme related to lactoylglutathione lyase
MHENTIDSEEYMDIRWVLEEMNSNKMSRINGHKIEHFETPADNVVDSLKDFYYLLFGWQFKKGQTQACSMIKMLAKVAV